MMITRRLLTLGIALSVGGCAVRLSPFFSIADAAERHVGKTPEQLGVSRTLWCAEFADLVRKEAGYKPVRSRRAIDQVNGGRKIAHPVRGSLMITRRGLRGHHVDVVADVLPGGLVRVIGGNVDGLVRERVLPAQGIFVLPT